MIKNPYLNAFLAAAYIVAVVTVISSFGEPNTPDIETIMAPIVMISLLVLSVSIMAFLFFYNPVILLIENKRREAVIFFAKTLGTFAVLELVFIVILLTIIR